MPLERAHMYVHIKIFSKSFLQTFFSVFFYNFFNYRTLQYIYNSHLQSSILQSYVDAFEEN